MINNIVICGSIFAIASTLMVAPMVAPALWKSQRLARPETAVELNESIHAPYAQAYRVRLDSMLTRAGSEIKDEDTSRFYTKLIQGYGLDKPAEEQQQSGLAGLVPDIRHIQHQALTLPFREAGKGITDPELADFYSDFIKRCGLDR